MQNENQESRPSVRASTGARPGVTPRETSGTAAIDPPKLLDTLLGTDPPIEKAHPGLQPVLVFASYPIMLILMISVIAFYFAFFRSKPTDSQVPAVHSESPIHSDSTK